MAVPYGENQYLYGLHDPGGEHVLKVGNTAKGWILVTEELGTDPNNRSGKGDFYQRLADQGFGIVVRLNHAYGNAGTIPLDSRYRDFAQRCANFVENSPGAHIWIIGNEINFEREQPRLPGSSQAQPITPRRYTACYHLCRQAIKGRSGHENDQVLVAPIGPWNGETPYDADPQGKYEANKIPGAPADYPYHGFWGDYIVYLRDMLVAIGRENCDGIAIHAYSHGYDPQLVFSDQKMGAPFENYYYHFRTYKDQMAIVPEAFRDLPIYLTESNGDVDPNGAKWPDVNSGWVKNAYQEINDWNKNNQQIRCVILYRWSRADDWHIDGKGQVQLDLRDAMAKNYQWDPDFGMTKPEPPPVETIPEPEVPPYRTRYISHNTPTRVSAAKTLDVDLTIENVGSFTWVTGGPNPFTLGFQWYDAAGQFVQLPAEHDYRTSLPQEVPPGSQVSLRAKLRIPEAAGTYQLRWDMVHELITWFTSQGDAGLLVSPMTVESAVEVVPPTHVEIQNVSQELTKHPTKRYATRALDAIRRVIVHHTATPASVSVQRIADFQVTKRDLPGIAYHFCTTDQGLAYQTQPLTVTGAHAGQNSRDSVGLCLIGNFMEIPPPQPQLNASASVLAQVLNSLKLTTNEVLGYSEIITTQSPGATWPSWKGPLLEMTNQLMATLPPEPPPSEKPIYHFMLFWYNGPGNWAEWDLLGAFTYIDKFHPALGFSLDEAKSARFVTIVGGPGGVPQSAEETLRAAGCQVERVAGPTETDTRRLLEKMAAENRRFLTLTG